MKSLSFTAPIRSAGGGGMYVVVPFNIEKEFGVKRLKAVALIDGEEYRGTILRMGTEDWLLIVLKSIREKIGKGEGDSVAVTFRPDEMPRVVVVPADLRVALAEHPAASAFFSSLAYTHQKEYVQWIESAKRPETRERRISKAIVMLLEKKKE